MFCRGLHGGGGRVDSTRRFTSKLCLLFVVFVVVAAASRQAGSTHLFTFVGQGKTEKRDGNSSEIYSHGSCTQYVLYVKHHLFLDTK